jgi:Kdo2-lipid IVA lauroyltransferase/acyltransferase
VKLFQTPWHLLEAAVVHSLLFVLGLVPVRVSLAVATGIAGLAFLVLGERRRVAIDNVLRSGITDDPVEARRIAREAFRAFVLMVVESTLVRLRMTEDNWRDFVTLAVTPELAALLEEPGRGVLVAASHVGNWEVVARGVSQVKPLCAIYRPFKNPFLERSVQDSRSGRNLRLITKYDADPLRFVKSLRGGEILAVMIDQHARQGIVVDFFGRPARTTPTVALLALVTKVPVVVTCAVRTGPLRYEVHGVGPLTFERTGKREADVERITQELTNHIETFARRWPEQYMWGHRRWKVQDAGVSA